MNEAAAKEADFAEGTSSGIYVINTLDSPERAAERYRLAGTIVTIAGDALGLQIPRTTVGQRRRSGRARSRRPASSTRLVARESLRKNLTKRRIPERIVLANLELYDAALREVRLAEVPGRELGCPPASFSSKDTARFRSGRSRRSARRATTIPRATAGPGSASSFPIRRRACNGCSLCVVQCPEGIIEFTADPVRGAIVHGARFADFCKVCRECVAACPLDLFSEVAAVTRPEGAATERLRTTMTAAQVEQVLVGSTGATYEGAIDLAALRARAPRALPGADDALGRRQYRSGDPISSVVAGSDRRGLSHHPCRPSGSSTWQRRSVPASSTSR